MEQRFHRARRTYGAAYAAKRPEEGARSDEQDRRARRPYRVAYAAKRVHRHVGAGGGGVAPGGSGGTNPTDGTSGSGGTNPTDGTSGSGGTNPTDGTSGTNRRLPEAAALASAGGSAAHVDAPGLARDIATLRSLVDRALATLQGPDRRVSLAEVEALSRIMGRLGSLVVAERRAGGGQHLNDHIRDLLPEVGRDLEVELT